MLRADAFSKTDEDQQTKQSLVAAAVGDVRQPNVAVDVEDAVPRHSRKSRRDARLDRPVAGVAAVTAHPIETAGPRRGGPDRGRERGLRYASPRQTSSLGRPALQP